MLIPGNVEAQIRVHQCWACTVPVDACMACAPELYHPPIALSLRVQSISQVKRVLRFLFGKPIQQLSLHTRLCMSRGFQKHMRCARREEKSHRDASASLALLFYCIAMLEQDQRCDQV